MAYVSAPAQRRIFAKPVALALAFTFLLSPLSPVLAEEVDTSTPTPADSPALTQPDAPANTPAPPAEESTLPTDTLPVEETSPEDAEQLPEEPAALDIAEEDVTPWNQTSRSKPDAKMDEKSGALIYTYPISLPPAREPAIDLPLTLTYNSQNQALSPFGYSWELSIPSIERVNKTGTDRLYDEQYFSSTISGELILDSGSTFIARSDEGERLVYTRTGDGWTMTDKQGTVYTFGDTSASRQDDPEDDSRVYKWMLSKVTSANGNTVVITYFKDRGQIYPNTVTYNGNGSRAGNLSVTFMRGYAMNSGTEYRNSPTLYSTGFGIKTEYLIDRVEVSHAGTVLRTYALAYEKGDADWKPLLSSVTESGRAEAGTAHVTLPPTVFSYKEFPAYEFTETSGSLWHAPAAFYTEVGNSRSTGLQIADLNGDTYPDFYKCDNGYASIHLNDTRGGWSDVSTDPAWAPQEACRHLEDRYTNSIALMFADVDGDLLLDQMYSVGTEYARSQSPAPFDGRIYLNTLASAPAGSPVWVGYPSYTVPGAALAQVDNDETIPLATRVADINGDGFPDFIFGAYNYPAERNDIRVYLGRGGDWVLAPEGTWVLPELIVEEHKRDIAALEDINGDNLPDILFAAGNQASYPEPVDEGAIYINTGSGWEPERDASAIDEHYQMPIAVEQTDYVGTDYGTRFADINGDGMTDLVNSQDDWTPQLRIRTGNTHLDQVHTDNLWLTKPLDQNLHYGLASNNGKIEHARLVDMNSDGVQDFIYSKDESTNGDRDAVPIRRTALGRGPGYSDILETITLQDGGKIKATYSPSSQYRSSSGELLNPALPLRILTVSSITRDNGRGAIGTDTYTYQGGHYYFNNPLDRRFAGFAMIEKKDSAGNVTRTYYHQGSSTNQTKGEVADHESKIGKTYRVEEFDNRGKLQRATTNAWGRVARGTGSFVKLLRTVTAEYDGLSSHAASAEEYAYDDASGNMTEHRLLGRVTAAPNGSYTDVAGDSRAISYEYARKGTLVTNFVSRETLTDDSGVKVKEVLTEYDGLPLGQATKGNPTTSKEWVAGSDYRTTTRTFNAHGLPTSSTDARGNRTGYRYDSYSLYPIYIDKPLGQTVRYAYDYSSGQAIIKIDENGQTYRDILDGVDRIKEERVPNPTTGALVVKAVYVYDDTATPRKVTRQDFIAPGVARATVTYRDGFGRTIQERREMEAGAYAIRDIAYDARGLVAKESLPYTGTGIAYAAPTKTASLYTSYVYDALERPTRVLTPTGAVTKTYANWVVTTTDQNGKTRIHTKDAFGSLVQVGEVNGGSTYLTNYAWDAAGNLSRVTDALGNIRNFTYDGIGNRRSAEDLHAPTDRVFGVRSYEYDLAGNMTRTTDARGVVTTIAYDSLNRPLSEDASSGTGIETSYTYDTCTNGKGKLCSAASPGNILVTYSYDRMGGVASESKRIGNATYTTSYVRDYSGNPTSTTYPDGSKVENAYNVAALLESVKLRESNGTVSTMASNFDYAPTDAVTIAAYGDGTTLTNTYDATKGYRLTKKQVTKGAAKLQDIAYEYDNVGNITKLTDTSPTASKKTVAYTYDDLYRLKSATATAVAASTTPYMLTYSYDAIGNLTNKEGVAYTYDGTATGNYANPHAATTVGGSPLTYDRNGNLLTSAAGSHVWDYKGRLSRTTLPNGTLVANLYDHAGERAAQNTGGVSTHYANDLYTASGNKKTRLIYGNGMLLASSEAVGSVVTPYFMHGDHLGSTNVVTSAAGAVVQTLDYYPYGSTRVDTSPDVASREYIGEVFDEVTGLSYLNARHYDGGRGQFLSQDPSYLRIGDSGFEKVYSRKLQEHLANPQALNSYAYAHGNPITNSDPNGEILPLLIGAWAIAEIGLSIYDGYNAYQTVNNPDASDFEKGIAVSGFAAGLIGPAGGYGTAGSKALQIYKQTNPVGQALMKGVQNEKVLNLIRDNYRVVNGKQIGSGSAVDAMLHTLKTGNFVGGTDHVNKVHDNVSRIGNLLGDSSQSFNQADKSALSKILRDSQRAIKKYNTKKK
ncbi:MAG: VCBS repeat-containing protein [Candidatus Pacebacteria bacterium]|nr:VCBS repeat-containing protein [Candidatus Paceibacterota bacterium]MBP9840524.1 VCBS repeat-containing protein [Candidatus Paceibacterota bacterium]